MKNTERLAAIFGTFVIAGTCFYAIIAYLGAPKNQTSFGASFDSDYARYLGLDVKKSFTTIVKDWGFKQVRLAANWDILQKTVSSTFDFSELDSLMNVATQNKAKIILTVGQKTPRWPECHRPSWLSAIDKNTERSLLLNYIKTVVVRYKNHPALEIWQVENEPFLPFGLCPKYSTQDLSEEINLVRANDPVHQILITDSGELSSWRNTALAGDLFGTTMYRVVWNKYIGYFNYDWLPAAFYRFKLWLVGRSENKAFVVELQGEPWIPDKQVKNLSLAEQFKSLDFARLKKNILFAQAVGFPRAYLWGAEWWQWMAQSGHPEFEGFIKQLPKTPLSN